MSKDRFPTPPMDHGCGDDDYVPSARERVEHRNYMDALQAQELTEYMKSSRKSFPIREYKLTDRGIMPLELAAKTLRDDDSYSTTVHGQGEGPGDALLDAILLLKARGWTGAARVHQACELSAIELQRVMEREQARYEEGIYGEYEDEDLGYFISLSVR